MTSNAHTKQYFHAEDKVEDVLETHLTHSLWQAIASAMHYLWRHLIGKKAFTQD